MFIGCVAAVAATVGRRPDYDQVLSRSFQTPDNVVWRATSVRVSWATPTLRPGLAFEVSGVVAVSSVTDGAPPERAPVHDVQQAPDVVSEFTRGYRDGGGPPEYEEHFVSVVIPCESGWQLDPVGYHAGLAQFAPSTWSKCAAANPGADYRSPWWQGYCVAWWVNQGVDPAGTGGWASCW
jgi:hypothetical protein